jgi:hypothetical protein
MMMLIEPSSSRLFGRQILIFHFPGVIKRVKRRVPDQVPERPGAGYFALGMQNPNGIAVGVAMCPQPLIDQQWSQLDGQTELLCPV